MALEDAHRKYFVRDQMIGPFVINFVLNAGLAWLLFRGVGTLSVWGDPGVIGDLIATMLILPFLLCVIATPLVRNKTRTGKTPALHSKADVPGWIMKLPKHLVVRALLASLVVAMAMTPVIIVFLARATAWQEVSVGSYALAKGALCDASRR